MRIIITILLLITSFFSNSQNPTINSILVNSCDDDEGINEQVVFTTGSNSIDIDDITITFPNGGSYCNTTCLSRTLINNQPYIDQLNSIAGCNLFLFSNIIPPNSQVIVFTGSSPSYYPNFSSECPGTYYVIFCNNTSTIGRFANSANDNRTLIIDFNGYTSQVTYYSSNSNTGSNGDYVSFDSGGNPTYNNSNICALPLPIELTSFIGNYNELTGYDELKWSTASEINNDRFDLYSSIDGIDWELIGSMNGAGNSTTQQHYIYNYRSNSQITYYKLKQVDYDGEYKYSDIISVYKSNKMISVKYFDILGKELPSEPENGLFIKMVQYEYQVEYKKIFKQ